MRTAPSAECVGWAGVREMMRNRVKLFVSSCTPLATMSRPYRCAAVTPAIAAASRSPLSDSILAEPAVSYVISFCS